MAATNPQQQEAVSDDFDYEIWAPTTKATLIDQGLWDVVENGVPPDPSKILESAAKIKPEELSQWRDLVVKDTKALQILQSSLPESTFRKTLSASSAKDVWDLLLKGKEQAMIRRLEKQFEEAKKGETESFDSFLDRVLEITDQLRGLSIEKSDYVICKKLFASLPESCDGVHSMLEEIMNVHHVSAASLVQYFYINGFKFDSVNEEILLVILKNLRLRSESKKWCGVCFKIDHNEVECNRLMLKRFEEEEGAYVEAEYRLSTPVSLSEKTYEEDIWVAYPCATSHMTPHEKYFITLDRTHKAEVGLVDGTLLKVEGKGSVQIRMKGGKKKSIKNVIFVPGLNRNVLSIEKMVSRRYSFSQEREDEWSICDRTGLEFGDAVLSSDENGFVMRLKVIEGNLTS